MDDNKALSGNNIIQNQHCRQFNSPFSSERKDINSFQECYSSCIYHQFS